MKIGLMTKDTYFFNNVYTRWPLLAGVSVQPWFDPGCGLIRYGSFWLSAALPNCVEKAWERS